MDIKFRRPTVYGRAFFFVFSLIHIQINGQGCSDAGFCTVQPLKPTNQIDSGVISKNKVVLGFSRGLGDFKIFVSTPYLEYTRFVNDHWSLSAKVVYLFSNGELAAVHGFSDVYLNVSHSFTKRFKGTLGLKLPLNRGDKKDDGYSLPMNYQTSLGSFDVIAGLSYYPIKDLGFTMAVQQPLTQNSNQFQKGAFSSPEAQHYATTYGYHRKGDVLFRINYRWVIVRNKLELTPGLLPIYHLGEDSYLEENGQRKPISGSKGLTLNGNLFLLFRFNTKNEIELNIGTPFVARKSRPDGLTRKYVFGIEYKVSF